MSYYNQREHPHLNRFLIVEPLRRMLAADVVEIVEATTSMTWEELLQNATGSEPEVIQEMANRGLSLPKTFSGQ